MKGFECETCHLGRMPQFKNNHADRRHPQSILNLVHVDLAGPVDPMSEEGHRYALSCVDDYSGLITVFFFKLLLIILGKKKISRVSVHFI